jgi:hypothetical protein
MIYNPLNKKTITLKKVKYYMGLFHFGVLLHLLAPYFFVRHY